MNFKKLLAVTALAFASVNASSAVVGVVGVYPDTASVSAGLSGYGHTVVSVGTLDTASLTGLNVVILGRNETGNADLATFVQGGGTLITEWTAAGYGMSLLGGTSLDNYSNALTGDSIDFTAAGLLAGLGVSIGASYSDGGATEFFQDILNIGTGTIYGTRGSTGTAALVGGAYGSGQVWVNGYDWADSPSAVTFALLNNEISGVQVVPEPGSLALLGLGLAGLAVVRRRKSA